jgi:gliding motility-associated-like protein
LVATDVIDINAGENFSYIVKSDGSLWATGFSVASIWLDLPNIQRDTFTQINPGLVPEACELIGLSSVVTDCNDSTFGSLLILNFGGQAPYIYSIGGVFQGSNFFENLGSGNYTVTIQDSYGCVYSSMATISGVNCPIPSVIPEEPSIMLPNVFSPNGDGQNDVFYFPNEGATDIHCEVYNRWGNLVYQWQDLDGSWKGNTLNNKACPEGTYYFIVSYKMYDTDWERTTGYVTLLR